MRKKKRTQFHSNFGYYGFGNLSSVFNRRPKPIFERIKTIYGDEMERLKYEKKFQNKFHQDLSKEEKEEIRKKVRISLKKADRKEFLKVLLLFTTISIVLFTLYFWV